MSDLLLPGLIAALAWWFSTGAILYLDGLPRRTFRWSMLGATVLLVAALFGLKLSAGMATEQGAYLGFFCGLGAWAWQEMAFLLGFVTGPREPGDHSASRGWRRFWLAVRAVLYHEIAILIGAAVVVALTWGEPNQVGTWTFLALWALRLRAKLNLFLGVRNLNENWIPEHLSFVKQFLTRRPMNLLFPVSISLSTIAAVQLVRAAAADGATPFEATGFALVAMLTVLAVLEHWLMVLPINTDAIWAWGLRTHQRAGSPAEFGSVGPDGPLARRGLDTRRGRAAPGQRRSELATGGGIPIGGKAAFRNRHAISRRQA